MSNGGTSYITEKLFENRLVHNAQQLSKMGARIKIVGDTAEVVGRNLVGAEVFANDLRGGAGLVVAALGAEGQTQVRNAEHIFRGYANLECLREVGADILLKQ